MHPRPATCILSAPHWHSGMCVQACVFSFLPFCMQTLLMAETPAVQPGPEVLDILLTAGIRMLTCMVPGWEPPKLDHPHAESYMDALALLDDIEPGDQVMVMATSGYFHHGVYVGKQDVAGKFRHAVVDFWGLGSKECATIGVRSFHDFVHGAAGFAKAHYPPGAALPHQLSARLALAWVDAEKANPTIYNIALENCEVFATICRCLRCATACHSALTQQLAHMPAAPPPALHRRGLK